MNTALLLRAGFAVLAVTALAGSTGCTKTESIHAPSPSLAFATGVDTAGSCVLAGMPRILATHVIPRPGVRAEVAGRTVLLRFARRGEPRAALAIDPDSLDVVDAEGIADGVQAAPPAQGATWVSGEDHHIFAAWTDGSVYEGLHVVAQTIDMAGVPAGPRSELGYEGSAIGLPAVAVDAAGRGVLAFIESNGSGFHLVATRVVCGAAGG